MQSQIEITKEIAIYVKELDLSIYLFLGLGLFVKGDNNKSGGRGSIWIFRGKSKTVVM